ncbi:MAG: hypothetical protein CMC31_00905 [Flavobacteriaceae bacterium]|nr:hypothetical protein [Flavobacteriaceae bacterium]
MLDLEKYLAGGKIIFCFLLLGSQIIFSQTNQDYKSFKGEIVSDSLNLSGIHIINKNSGAKSITNENGLFIIGVKKNDTIIISSIQIKPHVIVINQKVFNQDQVKVYVEPFVNQLENVVVKSHNLSGNLLNDMKDSGVKNPINFDDVGVPGFKGERAERIVYKNDAQILLNVLLMPIMPLDIEGIYKKLSGYYDNLKKTRILDKQFSAVFQAIEFYGVAFFMKNYNLKEDEVYEFVLGAMENKDIEENFRQSNHGLVLNSFKEYHKSISDEKI